MRHLGFGEFPFVLPTCATFVGFRPADVFDHDAEIEARIAGLKHTNLGHVDCGDAVVEHIGEGDLGFDSPSNQTPRRHRYDVSS